MTDATPIDDDLYALLIELDRLEALREDVSDGDADALTELQGLGFASLDALSVRIAHLHARVDEAAR